MIPSVNPRLLENIKALTLSVAGITAVSPMDCRAISFDIMHKTNLGVSETTLKRVFGFAMSKFSPSLYTLNALAIYCGYQSWEAFSRSQSSQALASEVQEHHLFDDPLTGVLLDTPVPTVILKNNAPHFTIITYNKAYEEATHTQKRDIRGTSLWESYAPEKAGGYGPTLLLEALHEAIYTLQPVQMKPLHYNIPSGVPNVTALTWWDIRIVPVIYGDTCKYLLLNPRNITEKVLHQGAIEQAIMKELTMAEDLATTNVKLNVAMERLAESHQELLNTKTELEELNKHLEQRVFDRTKKLFESEAKQRELIDNAPVAIGVLRGPRHVVETANKKLIEYWNKTGEVMNKPLDEALPELEGQPFIDILNGVRETGIAYANPELRALLNYNGVLQPRYFDMIYQPIQHVPGITDSIFIVAVDITEHVIAREKLKESEAMLRIAAQAAKIGIWSFDPQHRVINCNSMFEQILGWEYGHPMTFDEAIARVTEEYREKILAVVESAIADGGDFDFTYRQARFNDNHIIRLRATGKITTDDSGERTVFSGIMREVKEGE